MTKSKNISYYYTCPEPLGYLEIYLDELNKVQGAIFTDTEPEKFKKLPEDIRIGLDEYFLHGKSISRSLISKEVVGTDFQKSIWNVISKVRFGKTITYTDMTIEAGRPLATRATGTACGKNPIALFVPCHRVVRKNSEDYGYSWGTKRKKWLLEFERDKI